VTSSASIAAVVVLHDSERVVADCLRSVLAAAPRRGVTPIVVDNASRDGGAGIAAGIVGASQVVRLQANGGFAAGVNAGWARATTPFVAVLNPATQIPEGGLDRLADVLDAHPEAGLIGPRVTDAAGRPEATVGRYPTLAREVAHARMLHVLPWIEGRRAPFPPRTAPVDWVSGCVWLVRRAAIEQVGPLDERYFMYYEDVDFCRRLTRSGWSVLATPDVVIRHEINRGSTGTSLLPADGGRALIHYFGKFHPEVPATDIGRVLRSGWQLRRAWRRLRVALGDRDSAVAAERYRLAIEAVGAP